MSESAEDYEQAILRLIDRVRLMNEPRNPTSLRNEILNLEDRLDALVCDLETYGGAQNCIEFEHDLAPPPGIGPTGLPIAVERRHPTYSETLYYMRLLAESAKRAAEGLPDPRSRPALPFAALGLLHLRCRFGFARPRLSDTSPEVNELDRVCKAAGLVKARETLRNALSKELQSFDPYYIRPDIDWIINGG